jgi:ABC-2 type transport system permease protein
MNEITNPLNALTGGFDVAFVIVFLLPIVIIALTFDLVSREKEMGVIALIAAAGVSLPRTIFAKAAARGVLILSTLVIMSAAVMILGVDGPIPLGSWLRWLAVVSLYGGFWFALALAVNSRNRPSVTNGVILANIWLVLVVVVPAFVNTVTNALYPAPSRVELTTAMREATEEVDKAAAGAREAFFFDHPDMAGKAGNADAYFVQVIATNAAIEKAVAPLLATFDHQAAKRERTVDLLQYLSPALVAQQALTVLSATDSLRFADFTEQVLAFHRTWRDFFESRVLHGERMTAASFDQIPKFEYAARPMNAAGFLSALLSLAAVTGVLAIWSARRLNRYPVV